MSVLAPAQAGTVSGTATFRERIALPPGATFEAVIEDASRADAPAQVLGRFGPVPAGAPPFAFGIEYDDAAIMPGHRYGVRATVRHEGRLLFTTDRHVPAFAATSRSRSTWCASRTGPRSLPAGDAAQHLLEARRPGTASPRSP
ncbi:MAG: YbaY family lipoprotein [Burkholderiales bacterium]